MVETDLDFIDANRPLYEYLEREGERLGWHWFCRGDVRTFFIWSGPSLATVQFQRIAGLWRVEVMTSHGALMVAEDADEACEMVWAAICLGEG